MFDSRNIPERSSDFVFVGLPPAVSLDPNQRNPRRITAGHLVSGSSAATAEYLRRK
jgi:hypothetical protein